MDATKKGQLRVSYPAGSHIYAARSLSAGQAVRGPGTALHSRSKVRGMLAMRDRWAKGTPVHSILCHSSVLISRADGALSCIV